jgi:hypothetical protein
MSISLCLVLVYLGHSLSLKDDIKFPEEWRSIDENEAYSLIQKLEPQIQEKNPGFSANNFHMMGVSQKVSNYKLVLSNRNDNSEFYEIALSQDENGEIHIISLPEMKTTYTWSNFFEVTEFDERRLFFILQYLIKDNVVSNYLPMKVRVLTMENEIDYEYDLLAPTKGSELCVQMKELQNGNLTITKLAYYRCGLNVNTGPGVKSDVITFASISKEMESFVKLQKSSLERKLSTSYVSMTPRKKIAIINTPKKIYKVIIDADEDQINVGLRLNSNGKYEVNDITVVKG